MVVNPETPLPFRELVQSDGETPDLVTNNAAVVYDASTSRLWAVRNGHPLPTSIPNFMSSSMQLAWLPWNCVLEPGACKGWTIEIVAIEVPYALRTHNRGLVSDVNGRLINQSRSMDAERQIFCPSGILAQSAAAGWPSALWSYGPVGIDCT